jgi:hypothetical protein
VWNVTVLLDGASTLRVATGDGWFTRGLVALQEQLCWHNEVDCDFLGSSLYLT